MLRPFLFVHSPVVGPSSLRRLAAAAATAGHEVALPDLTSIDTAEAPQLRYVELAVEAGRSLLAPIVVGHSAAGAFLPSIADRLERSGGLLFVDAVVPPPAGRYRTSEPMKKLFDRQTVDGVLRPWLDWWPSGLVADLLPEPADRHELAADLPQLKRSFFDADVDVPAGWSDRACGYLRLSPAYDAELDEAASRGWPRVTLDSTHLGMHTEPHRVLDEILHLADKIG
jgi:hypothetical protein